MSDISRRKFLSHSGAICASSVLVKPGWAGAQALHAQSVVPLKEAKSNFRETLRFDTGWKFSLGNAVDAKRDFDFTYEFNKTGFFKFSRDLFDDSSWRTVNLPHDWAVELPFVKDAALMSHGYKPLGRGYPETSVGWYRRGFDIAESERGRRVHVQFDGAMKDTLVFLNGCFVGRSVSGYVPFELDVTDFLKYGETNYIVLRVDATAHEGWFYEGAGLYRHAWLVKMAPVHLAPLESIVRTELAGRTATLSLATVVRNDAGVESSPSVTWKILDAAGKTVGVAQSASRKVASGGQAEFHATATIGNVALWSVDTPNLYTAVLTVHSSGVPVDDQQITFGVRSAVFDANRGFALNGKQLKIQGTCNHQDHAGVGSALPDRLQYFRLGILKGMGSNAVRTAHNMPTPEWIEACDRMGMMVMCETRVLSSNPDAMQQLEAMIKRYRNSPSVIFWSIGNEEDRLQTTEADIGARIAGTMVRRCHQLDPTRPVSAAVNGRNDKGISDPLDIVGFNYHLEYPDAFHKQNPQRPVYGSETSSVVGTRGEYKTDTTRHTIDAYDRPVVQALDKANTVWLPFYATREWEAGAFAWTGFDYRGEPTPYGWPSNSSQFGIVDTCGFPKDAFYYYKAWWSKEPVLHVFPHWNFAGREGEEIAVWVYSNLDKVELFLNGKSLGIQVVPKLGYVQWKVHYEPGDIEARGYRGDRVELSAKRETTGAAVAFRLAADRDQIDADGEDLVVVTVEAIDDKGRAVPTANNMVRLKVTGAAHLIGVGNGDPNCLESDKEPRRSLFNGLAQAVVQSSTEAGEIRIEATSQEGGPSKLTSGNLIIRARPAKVRLAVPLAKG
jgi:beta-galactosidase